VRRRKFTPHVVAQIRHLLDQGVNTAEIASKIGCTVGSLRVTCSRLAISLRRRNTTPRKSNQRRTPARKPRELAPSLQQHSRKSRASQRTRVTLLLQHGIVDQLRKQSATKGVSHSTLAAKLIEAIVLDNLFEAVLDEAELETRRHPLR